MCIDQLDVGRIYETINNIIKDFLNYGHFLSQSIVSNLPVTYESVIIQDLPEYAKHIAGIYCHWQGWC